MDNAKQKAEKQEMDRLGGKEKGTRSRQNTRPVKESRRKHKHICKHVNLPSTPSDHWSIKFSLRLWEALQDLMQRSFASSLEMLLRLNLEAFCMPNKRSSCEPQPLH